MVKTQAEVRELKVGGYLIIDDEPCKILSITTSKPGKHGEAKARIDATGLFDGKNRSIVYPVKHKVAVPIIDRRTAQVIAIMGETIQLMDMVSYDTFELALDETVRSQLTPGQEVQYLEALGRRKIILK